MLGDELAGFAKALLREFGVDDEALAVEEIMSVGPGGNHLARPETPQPTPHRDFWMPTLLDKAPHDRWKTSGATSSKQRVEARVAELRSQPRAFSLDADTTEALERLLGSQTASA